ncbi:MAG: OmpA family protein, partial [Bacteroidia bacterium]
MMTRLLQRVISPILIFCWVALPLLAQAQGNNPKLDKIVRKADMLYATYKLTEAAQAYQELLNADPSNFHAAYRMGEISTRIGDFREAQRWYRQALDINPEANDTAYLKLGITYKRLGNYMKAKESFLMFQRKHANKEDDYFNRATREIKGCDFAEEQIAPGKKPQYRVDTMANVNSLSIDMYPSVLDQRQQDKFLVFTSHRLDEIPAGGKPKKGKNDNYQGLNDGWSDLFMSVMENDSTFTKPVRFGSPINTEKNDGNSSFTGDGLTLYYASNIKSVKDGAETSLFQSRYDFQRKMWGKPEALDGVNGKQLVVVNTKGKTKEIPSTDLQPNVSKDGMTLCFVSNRDGGKGGKDIWICKRTGTGWSAPVNAGSNINTAFNEVSPYLNEDGTKLFFSSEGHVGFGGYDLYVSTLNDNGEFGEPVNLGHPINSSYDDHASMFFNNDSLAYFTSDRPGGKGRDDLYRAKFIVYPYPELTVSVQGTLRDRENKQPIQFGTAILYEVQEDGTIAEVDRYETDQTARYSFTLEENKRYKIVANAKEYLANETSFATNSIFPCKERGCPNQKVRLEKNIDIEVEPIELTIKPIVLQNIYYDYDKYYIREDAAQELKKLAEVLRGNPQITIQMGSHTDTNGGEDYNKTLSENRAKAAVQYLIDVEKI